MISHKGNNLVTILSVCINKKTKRTLFLKCHSENMEIISPNGMRVIWTRGV